MTQKYYLRAHHYEDEEEEIHVIASKGSSVHNHEITKLSFQPSSMTRCGLKMEREKERHRENVECTLLHDTLIHMLHNSLTG